jgi:hypothetical protein
MSSNHEFSSPLGSLSAARLEFARGASRVTLRADGALPDLFRARFDGLAPMVLADSGRVTIEYPLISPSEWLHPNRRAADVVLNSSVVWELAFGGGVSRIRGDLAEIELGALEISGGASDVGLALGAPSGVVGIRVRGGASKLTVHRPADTAVRLSIDGGVSNVALDDQRFGAIGRGTQLETPFAGDAADRYEIEIGGGARDILVATHP